MENELRIRGKNFNLLARHLENAAKCLERLRENGVSESSLEVISAGVKMAQEQHEKLSGQHTNEKKVLEKAWPEWSEVEAIAKHLDTQNKVFEWKKKLPEKVRIENLKTARLAALAYIHHCLRGKQINVLPGYASMHPSWFKKAIRQGWGNYDHPSRNKAVEEYHKIRSQNQG